MGSSRGRGVGDGRVALMVSVRLAKVSLNAIRVAARMSAVGSVAAASGSFMFFFFGTLVHVAVFSMCSVSEIWGGRRVGG